jgi:hypothetical protein
VVISIDGKDALTLTADSPRPDLVPAVTPDPRRGFVAHLPAAAVALLASGTHEIAVRALRTTTGNSTWELPSSPLCESVWRRSCSSRDNCTCSAPERSGWITISNTLRCRTGENACPAVQAVAGATVAHQHQSEADQLHEQISPQLGSCTVLPIDGESTCESREREFRR